MKKFIPRPLKYPLIALYITWRCLTRGKSAAEARLNLAGVLPADPQAIVHGGKVKLLALRERFGDTWKHFNIAYFASSGLPFAPGIWLKIYKAFGIKTVWNQNGLAYPAWAGKEAGRINALLMPIHGADYVVFQTEFTKRCTEKFLGAYAGESSVLINPVDTEKFKPRETALAAEPFVIIMSGHHFESKERLEVSLEAVRHVPGAKLLVIGNRHAVPKEDWIEIVGTFTQEEAPALYQRGHALLHLKSLDPCPTIVLEALASGLPVIGLGNGGMPELVDAKSGILLPAQEDFENFHYPSPEDVAEAITRVRTNLEQFSRSAREQSLKFDKKIWLKKHKEIFSSLLHI